MTGLNRHLGAALLLVLLVVLAYANSLRNDFVYDDNYQIVRNPFLHPDRPWKPLLTSDVWGYTRPGERGLSNYYRPLQMLTYRLTAQRAGLNPWTFHSVNLIFHLLATLAAYAVFWQLTQQSVMAVPTAVLFALHPIHTEAVVWISALTELGCALFFFLSFYLFLLTRVNPSPASRSPDAVGAEIPRSVRDLISLWAASLVCFLLALLWKEMALTLPVVIAAYVLFFSSAGRPLRSRIGAAARASLPYWAVVAGYVLLRYQMLGFFSRVHQPWVLSPGDYILSVINLVAKYWLKLLLPLELNAFHVFDPVRSVGEPRALASVAFVVLAGSLILYGLRRPDGRPYGRAPLAAFAAAWVFLTLPPVLHLRAVGMNVFSERYLYIPSLGFCLFAVWLVGTGLGRLPQRSRPWVGTAALALVAVLYLVQTVKRNPAWKNDFTFYSRTVEASPQSALMHNSLAQILREQKGDLEGAERHYLLAITAAMQPRLFDRRQIANAYVGLAGVYTQRRQYDKALAALDRGEAMDKSFAEIHVARGVVLMRMGRLKEAQKILFEIYQEFPNDEVVLNALGMIALAEKDYELAIDFFRRALEVLPAASDLHHNLGRAYGELARYAEALPHLQRAVELAPNNPVFHTNLGVALGRLGRLAEARVELERALALAPDYQPARSNLTALEQLERQPR